MQLIHFRIENFRNIKLAECHDVPQFMVICGGNGCGKSSILEAIMAAKERVAGYGNFAWDPRFVSADAPWSTITLTLSFTAEERAFAERQSGQVCPESETITVEFDKNGANRASSCTPPVQQLLSNFSRSSHSLGYFDFINAHRLPMKMQLSVLDMSALEDVQVKQTLAQGSNKFTQTKQYLASLVLRDLQDLQTTLVEKQQEREAQKNQDAQSGSTGDNTVSQTVTFDVETMSSSLRPIQVFFNDFFYPMRFKEVLINTSPYQFIVETPKGSIDIDDLSSGEKEVFNTFVRFRQLEPHGSIILFDEADAHLHPDLERRYLACLQTITSGNQLILTTHSPEMMMAAGTTALYTVLKDPARADNNQLVRVTDSDQLHAALVDLMGSRGLVSFNQRIIFIEGEEASADREIYEALYPQSTYHVSFVPAGGSATVRKTAERVNELLSVSVGFQQYFSIVDGDIDRLEPDPSNGTRLFKLPVYHVENLLLDEEKMLEATRRLLLSKCPYDSAEKIADQLKVLALTDQHVKPYAAALLDAKVAQVAKQAQDAYFRKEPIDLSSLVRPEFADVEQQARQDIKTAIDNGTWRAKCKGRDLLRAYCRGIDVKYESFRNILIGMFQKPPEAIDTIMAQIFAE